MARSIAVMAALAFAAVATADEYPRRLLANDWSIAGLNERGQVISWFVHSNGTTLPMTGIETERSGAALNWYVETSEKTLRVDYESGDVTAHTTDMVTIRYDVGSGTATVTTRLASDGPGILHSIRVTGVDDIERLHLHEALSPVAANTPYNATNLTMFPSAADFAVVYDKIGEILYHFRPDPTTLRSADLVIESAPDDDTPLDLGRLHSGAYVAITSVQSTIAARCIEAGVDIGPLEQSNAFIGDGAAVLELVPDWDDNGYSATVVIGFGPSADEARATGEDILQDDIAPTDAAPGREYWSAAETLRRLRHPESGSVIESPSLLGSRYADRPRDGAWAAIAMDTSGEHDAARRLLAFYAAVAKEDTGKAPLPYRLYSDGTPASPGYIVDFEGQAWFIYACWRHVSENPDALDAVWPAVARAADFLTDWAHPLTRAPLPSYDPALGRDSDSRPLSALAAVALEKAQALSEMMGETRPEWPRRRTELLSFDAQRPAGAEVSALDRLRESVQSFVYAPAPLETRQERVAAALDAFEKSEAVHLSRVNAYAAAYVILARDLLED